MSFAQGSSDKKPHGHQGILKAYDGTLLDFSLTKDEESKLESGSHVQGYERSPIGKGGRGFVVQDVGAVPSICIEKIRDLKNYDKYVPTVKKIQIRDEIKFENGTEKTKAKFDVSVFGVKFGYYLDLTFEPKYNTYTWTLDYNCNSDFDDNIGHWQVMKHPTKSGWSRILYSCQVKLFPWIPSFVVNFLTKTALVESTTWVKKESELLAKIRGNKEISKPTTFKGWFSAQATEVQAKFSAAASDLQNSKKSQVQYFKGMKEELNNKWEDKKNSLSLKLGSICRLLPHSHGKR